MRIALVPLVSAQVLNASFFSKPQQLNMIFGYSIQAVITGTPTGSVRLQASNDQFVEIEPGNNPPIVWTDISGSTFTVTAAGNEMWNVSDVGYTWVRIAYTDTSGGTSAAVMNANVNIKGF